MTGISALGIGFRNGGAESKRGRRGDFISLLTDFTVSSAGFSSIISGGVSGGLGGTAALEPFLIICRGCRGGVVLIGSSHL